MPALRIYNQTASSISQILRVTPGKGKKKNLRILSRGDDGMGAKNKTQSLTPKESHAESPSLKTIKKGCTLFPKLHGWDTRTLPPGTGSRPPGHYPYLRINLNAQKNSFLNQATQRKYLPNFLTPKKSRNGKLQTQKILPSSPSFEPV